MVNTSENQAVTTSLVTDYLVDRFMSSLRLYGKVPTHSVREALAEVMLHRPDRLDEFWQMRQEFPLGKQFRIDHDGFLGDVRGYYIRRDGVTGVVLQEAERDERPVSVCHVYGRKWLHD